MMDHIDAAVYDNFLLARRANGGWWTARTRLVSQVSVKLTTQLSSVTTGKRVQTLEEWGRASQSAIEGVYLSIERTNVRCLQFTKLKLIQQLSAP